MLKYDWGGYYEAVKSCNENVEKLSELDTVFVHLENLEKTRTNAAVFRIIKNISEQDCNKLNSPLLDFLKNCLKESRKKRILFAIQKGNLEAVKFLLERERSAWLIYDKIARYGTAEMLEYFIETPMTINYRHFLRECSVSNTKKPEYEKMLNNFKNDEKIKQYLSGKRI